MNEKPNGGLYITNKWLVGVLVTITFSLFVWVLNSIISSQDRVNTGVIDRFKTVDERINNIDKNLAVILQSLGRVEGKLNIVPLKDPLNKP